jgi:hypothetical protein
MAGRIVGVRGVDRERIVRIDWQYPWQLPPRFRNNCAYEVFTARPYCSNHCGSDYQFLYCSEASFGCCHVGRGYCALWPRKTYRCIAANEGERLSPELSIIRRLRP